MDHTINIKCPIHRKENVVTSCTHSQCTKLPLVCPLCPDSHNEHYSNLVTISEWIQRISKAALDGSKIQKTIKETNSIDSVLKWCEDDEMHLRKVDEHCRAQKALIAEDINFVRELFNEKCIQTQILLESELEDFLQKYKEQFKICKQCVDDSYSLYRNCNSFANPNNLIIKLQQSSSKEAQELTTQLKKLLRKDTDPLELIKSSADRITEMTYNLPVYQFQEGIENICTQMSEILSTHLKSKLNIQKPMRPVSPIKYVPKNLHKQYSLPQENLKSPRVAQNSTSPKSQHIVQSKSLVGNFNDVMLKALKKYQLDFAVASIEVVSQQVFALTCSQDPHLRIFDTCQKRIHTLAAHGSTIIQMQKSSESGQPLQVNNGAKTNTFLFTLSNDSFIVWSFEIVNQNLQVAPQIYLKYSLNNCITQFCYLLDNQCVAMGDKDGGLEIFNFQSQKIQQAQIKGKHSKQISSIVVLKRQDKLAMGSYDQTISIWKMLYQQQFENTYCECIIQCGSQLGQITNMGLLMQNPNLLVIGSCDGSLKVVNLVNQCIVLESEVSKNSTGICDFIVAEDPRKESVYAIALLQSSKTLRLWKLQHSELGWNQNESKIEIALSISDNMTRSKLQLVMMPQNSQNPLVLISNETNKELLVYEILVK